jgi:Protein of unknown function (DUF3592)
VVGGLVVIACGLAFAYGGLAELVGWLRRRARLRRTTAVIVGLHEPIWGNPGSRGRSPVFRFTTQDGRVIDAVSSASTFPEPKVGRRIPIAYDPADPQRTAERIGVRTFKLFLSPVLIAGGLAFAFFGVTLLD